LGPLADVSPPDLQGGALQVELLLRPPFVLSGATFAGPFEWNLAIRLDRHVYLDVATAWWLVLPGTIQLDVGPTVIAGDAGGEGVQGVFGARLTFEPTDFSAGAPAIGLRAMALLDWPLSPDVASRAWIGPIYDLEGQVRPSGSPAVFQSGSRDRVPCWIGYHDFRISLCFPG
jgi:hypothetical protein